MAHFWRGETIAARNLRFEPRTSCAAARSAHPTGLSGVISPALVARVLRKLKSLPAPRWTSNDFASSFRLGLLHERCAHEPRRSVRPRLVSWRYLVLRCWVDEPGLKNDRQIRLTSAESQSVPERGASLLWKAGLLSLLSRVPLPGPNKQWPASSRPGVHQPAARRPRALLLWGQPGLPSRRGFESTCQ